MKYVGRQIAFMLHAHIANEGELVELVGAANSPFNPQTR